MDKIFLESTEREELIDITHLVQEKVDQNGWDSGALVLFCPHTTAALTVNENADPAVVDDMTSYLRKMIPAKAGFAHVEGNSDAHIKTTLIGPSLTLIVEEYVVQLGTWQGIYFFEGDGPRRRQVWVQFLQA